MAYYTNIVAIISHAKHARLGTLQNSYIVNPRGLGCAFVSIQVSLDYFLHDIPEERPHAITILFWNHKLTHKKLFSS